MENQKKQQFGAKYLAKIAVLSALAAVLYILEFAIPIFPSFLELNFSDIATLIAGFALGPIGGCVSVVIKILLKLLMTGSRTVGVGELSNMIASLAFVLPASIVYKYKRNLKGALIGLIIGTVCSVGAAILSNRFIIVPAYLESGLISMDGLVGMCRVISSKINKDNFYSYYLLGAVLPFNLIRCLASGLITFFVYKRIAKILNDF